MAGSFDPQLSPAARRATYLQQLKNWMASVRRYRGKWAPAGGGGRECARRRSQIERGMLLTTEGQQRLREARKQ